MGMRRKDYLQSLVEAAIAVSHAEFKAGSMCEYEQAAQLRDIEKMIDDFIIVECNKQKKWARKYEN